MKIALVSDLHANLQAWRAVLLDIRSMRLDAIICLGDAVGYGPSPADVVASLAAHANHCLLGNHDAALCGKIQTSSFTPEAAQVIAWTRGRVGKNVYRYLASLPLTVAAGEFRCAHGEFAQPAFYHYIHGAEDALASWKAVPEPLLFVGHTHRPAIAVRRNDGECRMLPAQDFILEPGFRYLVNVGSVGQPRDGDARAAYCIYDQDQKAVFWRRLPFDLDAYRAALRQAGVPESASPFLNDDPLASAKPPEKQGGFHPPTDPAQAAQGAVEVVTVDLLRRRVRVWRAAALALLTMVLGLGACLAAYWNRHADRSLRVAGAVLTPLDASLWPRESNLVALAAEPTRPNEPLPGWSLHLGDSRRQSVRVETLEEGDPALTLESAAPRADLRLISRDILVEPGARVAVQAMIRKDPAADGTLALLLLGSPDLPGEKPEAEARFETLAVKTPNEPRQGGWLLARQTLDLPARIRTVRVVLQGRFSGTARVKDIRFVRRK
jgi:predicted phosphodiesterase